MEFRSLGRSGLKVPILSFGTATFGGSNEFFKAWGNTQVAEAKKLVDICLEANLNLFDTSNSYSDGKSEEILGEALKGRRKDVLISTKASIPIGEGPNDYGSSRTHLIRACEESLRRLGTDYIDLYHMHIFDGRTPIEETLRALDDLVTSGKIRYIACSNFSGWHLMKSLAISEKNSWSRYVAHQTYYSLVGRELEWELMPLAQDQGVGTIVWSPLAGGALTGKIRRNTPAPKNSRVGTMDFVPFDKERLFVILDALDEIAKECNRPVAQVALNWVLYRPTVASVIIGARTAEQLKDNLGVLQWRLTEDQVKRLDAVSEAPKTYPYWLQDFFPDINPSPLRQQNR